MTNIIYNVKGQLCDLPKFRERATYINS